MRHRGWELGAQKGPHEVGDKGGWRAAAEWREGKRSTEPDENAGERRTNREGVFSGLLIYRRPPSPVVHSVGPDMRLAHNARSNWIAIPTGTSV